VSSELAAFPPDARVAAPDAQRPRRIVVLGITGTGKTTFARRLASLIDARHVELDSMYHEPGWTPAEPAVFRERVTRAIQTESWVADGGYRSHVWDILWVPADTIVWLDYPFRVSLWRLFWRSLRRGVRNEELWNGNRETLRGQFLSRDSLFVWAFKSRTKWKETLEYLRRPELAHLKLVRLRRPRDAERWLRAVAAMRAPPSDA
jgi:adenylate kinase family enzyme